MLPLRAVVRRVLSAKVKVDDSVVGEIGSGLLVYLGVSREDDVSDLKWLSSKLAGLRVFDDREGRMNLSVLEVSGDLLVVSQFTLFGNVRKGFRPSFNRAASPEQGKQLYEQFVENMESLLGKSVATGKFGAEMEIHALDDGPVTLMIDTKDKRF